MAILRWETNKHLHAVKIWNIWLYSIEFISNDEEDDDEEEEDDWDDDEFWDIDSFENFVEMIAFAIAAPTSLHFSVFSNLLGSKLLIKTDGIDIELDDVDEDETDEEPIVDDDEMRLLLTDDDDGGGAEQIAFKSLSIPSNIRISKSILLFNSSFYIQ